MIQFMVNMFLFFKMISANWQLCAEVPFNLRSTVCPKSLCPFNIVTYYTKWIWTSWTFSSFITDHQFAGYGELVRYPAWPDIRLRILAGIYFDWLECVPPVVEVDARYLSRPTGQPGVDLNIINNKIFCLFYHISFLIPAFNPIHNIQ